MPENDEERYKQPEPPKNNIPEEVKRNGRGKRGVDRDEAETFKSVLREGITSPEAKERFGKLKEEIETPIVEANLVVLDKLLGFESVYPYESRDPRGRIEGAQDFVSRLYRDNEVKPENRVWLRSMEDDLNWLGNSLSLLEGFSAGMPYNFGGTDRMSAELYDKPRKIPTMSTFDATFSKDSEVPISRVEMKETKDIRELVTDYQDKFLNLQMTATALTQFDPSKANFGLIDGKVSLMSFCNIAEKKSKNESITAEDRAQLTPGKVLLMSIVINKQIQLKEDGTIDISKEDSYLIPGLSRVFTSDLLNQPVTLEHIKQIFPKEVLQWYTTVESKTEKKDYVASLMALIESDTFAKIDTENEKTQETLGTILTLAQEVIEKRNFILRGGKTKDSKGVVTEEKKKIGHADREFKYKLMEFVIKKGFVEGIGVGSASEMGWNFEWYIDEEGVQHRRSVTGSINTATDLYTPRYWVMHKALYDVKASKRAAIWPASTSTFREGYLENKRPDQKPEVPSSVDKDPVLKDALNRLFGGDPVWEASVQKLVNPDSSKFDFKLNPAMVDILKKYIWYWETPYASFRDTEKTRNAKERYTIDWPVFIPPEIPSINMLNSLKVEKDTVWQALAKGKKMSEIPWSTYKDHAYDWWLVNNQMMSRWLKEIVDLSDTYHDRDYGAFYGGIGGIKDLIKRDELGNRGLKLAVEGGITVTTKKGKEVYFDEIPGPMLEVMTVPMLIALNLMDKYHVVGPEFATSTDEQSRFRDEVTEWLVMCYYLPGTKPTKAQGPEYISLGGKPTRDTISWKFEGYNVAMMKMLWFYTRLAFRTGIDYGYDFGIDKLNVRNTLTNQFN